MPKTSMDKNHGFAFRQYDIGLARKVSYMQPVAETVFMQKAAHQHFGFSVLTSDARHVVAPGFFGMYIRHGSKILQSSARLVFAKMFQVFHGTVQRNVPKKCKPISVQKVYTPIPGVPPVPRKE